MPNDVSYFKVPGDSTTYQFNDPDAESRIGALESTVNDQAGDIADNTSAIGTLSNLATSTKTSLVAAINEVDAHADTIAAAISSLNSKFINAGDVSSVQFGVTDTNLQIRFDCGAARGVYFLNINRGTAQLSLMRTYNGSTTTIWTLP